jgi:hypothetical protein
MKAWMTMAVATAALAAGAAQASDVSWSVTIGSPRPAPRVIYTPPPVIYSPPPVVYTQAPVVYHPAPVVVQQVVQPVYRVPPGHAKHWKKHAYKHGYHHGYHQGYRHGRDDD